MRARRTTAALAVAIAAAVVSGAFSPAAAQTQRELIAEAVAQSFTLRATADMGGAAKLPFFFGSYADANVTAPPASADGQASWYNLGIAETAAFTPPGECTAEEQERRIRQASEDLTTWIVETAIPKILEEQKLPVFPVPTVPCTERLPGFSQSRYPETETIKASSSHDLLGSALCGSPNGCAVAGALAPLTGGVLDGGRFVASATDKPSQSSDAMVAGLTVPGVLSIGSARSVATAALEGNLLVTEASWTATDVCVAPGLDGCAIAIRSIRQAARIVRNAAGRVVERQARTVIAGAQGNGQAAEVTTADLGPGLPPIDLGGRLFIRAVSSTGGCGDPAGAGVADAGGLEIFGKGQEESPLPPTGLPIVGSATGGGVTLGGACAGGRLSEATFELPGPAPGGGAGFPGGSIVVPPGPGGAFPPGVTGPVLSAPRVVRKDSVRYVLRSAPAWRTAPYWASVLGALLLACAFGYVFRASRPVAPIAGALDRFARQFVRG